MAHVLVTGANGYVGSHLVSLLLEKGHMVTAVDWMVYGRHPLAAHVENPLFRLVRTDVRALKPDIVGMADVVCDMAVLSNDAAGDLNPELTHSINYRARRRVALLAKALGVKRYVIASSASIYGSGGGKEFSETSPLNPISVYAQCNKLTEEALFGLNDEEFSVTSLRSGTLFGLSRRMRFDVVLNSMTLNALKSKKISIHGDGKQHRPLIHVQDVARAFVDVVEAPVEAVRGQSFNLALGNFSIKEITQRIQNTLPFQVEVVHEPSEEEKKDYRVTIRKAKKAFGFTPEITIEQGIMEVFIALATMRTYPSSTTRTVDVYKNLIAEGRLTPERFVETTPGRRRLGS
jgi:nucleoside-diphosphate-sugar epimerase